MNVSSMWGICGASCEVHYSAVKAGVIGLTKALAKEVGPSGIRVNCIAPGAITTRMNDNLDEEAVALLREETPLGRMGTTGRDCQGPRLPGTGGQCLHHRTGAQPQRRTGDLTIS